MGIEYKKLVKRLKDEGYSHVRTNGSHEMYHHPNGKKCVVKCTKKYIPTGTQKSIERQTGIKF